MAISEGEWRSIRALVERMNSSRAEEFITGTVIKSDKNNRNVYLKEFGTQPIPVIANQFEVTYYDTVWNGSKNVVTKKTAKITLVVPPKGAPVVVAREMGTHRLPRCLGIMMGKNWVITGDD